MMPSTPIRDRDQTRQLRRLSAGSAHACVSPPDCSAIAPPVSSRNIPCARSLLDAHPCFPPERSQQPVRSNLLKPQTAAESP